jgi:hypothetical protein
MITGTGQIMGDSFIESFLLSLEKENFGWYNERAKSHTHGNAVAVRVGWRESCEE